MTTRHAQTPPLYQLQNLQFTYPAASQPALLDINLMVQTGEFLAICGTSGCGKSTLLRQLKTVLTPYGQRQGSVQFKGQALEAVDQRQQTARIGFVQQNPDNQIVTDMVWHELAFGLESLGTQSQTIRLRVAEMASFFGIQDWYHRSVNELSGGQRQLLNLAAVMTMQPDVLILDEPTSQLDPIAAADFLATLHKINSEIGTTIILSEHRLEEVLPLVSRVAVLDSGQLLAHGSVQAVARQLQAQSHPMLQAMPTPTRVYLAVQPPSPAAELENSALDTCPITVGEGRAFLRNYLGQEGSSPSPNQTQSDGFIAAKRAQDDCFSATKRTQGDCSIAPNQAQSDGSPASERAQANYSLIPNQAQSDCSIAAKRAPTANPIVQVKNAWFCYDKNAGDILRGLNLEVQQGEFLAIVGGNGTGKTTALNVIAGLLQPYRGQVKVFAQKLNKHNAASLCGQGVAVLPQDPQTLFTAKTVRQDLQEVLNARAAKPPQNSTAGRATHNSGKDKKTRTSPHGSTADNLGQPEADSLAELENVARLVQITPLLEMHPYDLSGGEQQRAALAKVLLTRPKLLLLDEPTKGMDGFFKTSFAAILENLRAEGLTVVMVSHDLEFCANYASRCALFFDGGLVTQGAPSQFFSGNSFYTTAANRMSRNIIEQAITVEDVISQCNQLSCPSAQF